MNTEVRKMDLFLPAICPLWVLVRATDLVVSPATGSSCKAKNLLRRTQESFHLVLALSTALSSAAAWEFSMKRNFEQKRDLYQATVLYIFVRKVFVKKALTDPNWIRKSSVWIACIPAARHSLGLGESWDQHLAPPYPKRLPEPPGCHLHWHQHRLWVLCRKR